ncbi:hypothetical protein BH09MYX1_BH09MYX1_18320 [soil metagenome]
MRARALSLGFAFQFAILDLALRGPRSSVATPSLALGALASMALWWYLGATERRGVRIALAFVTALIVVTQLGFYRFYHVFYGVEAAGAARFMWGDTKPMLLRIAPWLALGTVVLACAEWALLRFGEQRAVRPWRALAALVVLGLSFMISTAGAPDVSAVAALVRFALPQTTENVAAVVVPEVRSTRRPAAVLLLLDESIRASDYCSAPGPCALAPRTAAVTPDRITLREMRAVASYTALSVGALFTGHLPIEGRKVIAESPMIFDLARAIRMNDGSRPTVHYVSAQTDSFFERKGLRAELETFVTVDDLVGHPVDDIDDVIDLGTDRLLADRAALELAKLRPPFLFVAHFGGTHAPYFVDDASAPYRPYSHATGWGELDQLHAAYKDAIYTQDESVARVIEAFYRAAGDAPTLVLFTSDHGESFGEHAAIHHGQDLYDEQIHVPGFAVLHHDEREALLRAHEGDFVTHLDVLPTIVDMFGAHLSFPFQAIEAPLKGRSLLRAFPDGAALQTLAVTNCTDVFPCPVKTYGILRGAHALTAQPWDYGWRCVDLHDDATLLDPRSEECVLLGKASHDPFPTLPYGAANPL